MDKQLFDTALNRLTAQRECYRYLCYGLLALAILLAFGWHYSARHTTTVVVPPVLNQSVSLHGAQASASYLMQMSRYLSNLRLTISSETAKAQNQAFLDMVALGQHAAMSQALTDEQKQFQKKNVYAVFYPERAKVDVSTQSVVISGNQHVWLGEESLISRKVAYRLTFTMTSLGLRLQSFQEVPHAS